MDRKKQQVPFDFAQGRLSTALPCPAMRGRKSGSGRDDKFV